MIIWYSILSTLARALQHSSQQGIGLSQALFAQASFANMAHNVYGEIVDDETLKAMPQYRDNLRDDGTWNLTSRDRAKVAYDMMHTEHKDANAVSFVEKIKSDWGTGVATLVTFYNATGNNIDLMQTHDYWGRIGPSPYPITVRNGQWGAFVHVKSSGASAGSNAAVVYRGCNAAGDWVDWCFAWDTPWGRADHNKVYTEVREATHYDNNAHWGDIQQLLSQRGSSCTEAATDGHGLDSSISTGDGTTAYVTAILSLP